MSKPRNLHKLRFMYWWLEALMFGESFVWTVMDLLRSARERQAKRIDAYLKETEHD